MKKVGLALSIILGLLIAFASAALGGPNRPSTVIFDACKLDPGLPGCPRSGGGV